MPANAREFEHPLFATRVESGYINAQSVDIHVDHSEVEFSIDIDGPDLARTNDAYNPVYRWAYDNAYAEFRTVQRDNEDGAGEVYQWFFNRHITGDWNTSDNEDAPEMKEERGGALDEFLNTFKLQQTTNRKK